MFPGLTSEAGLPAAVAGDAGANDTAGTFLVELIPPGSKWEPANVQTLYYAFDTEGDC